MLDTVVWIEVKRHLYLLLHVETPRPIYLHSTSVILTHPSPSPLPNLCLHRQPSFPTAAPSLFSIFPSSPASSSASGSNIETDTDSADDSVGCSAADGERRLTPAASTLSSVVLAVFGGAGGRGAVGGGPGLKVWRPY
jgi:hypothetical protein